MPHIYPVKLLVIVLVLVVVLVNKSIFHNFVGLAPTFGNLSQMEERKMKLHPSLTEDIICDAVERQMFSLDNPGFCVACGAENDGCEPDAEKYPCEICGENQVYGAEQLLLMTVA
jgi:hypothetical protein